MPSGSNSTGNESAETPPDETRAVSDGQLMQQISAGDEGAFATLIERHSEYLFGIAHSLSANAADAEDLVQETFAAVLKSRFRGEASVRTWLVSILVRQAAMLRRSFWRRRFKLTL